MMLAEYEIETWEGRERGATETWVVCQRRHPRTNSGLRCDWSQALPVSLRNAAEFVAWLNEVAAEHDSAHVTKESE